MNAHDAPARAASSRQRWASAETPGRLLEHQVHVWSFGLNGQHRQADRYWGLLAPDERARAKRFHFAADRHRFAAGRGILRVLLGRYLDALPGVLRFEYSPHGKPEIAVAKEAGLAFNLSHAGDLGLLAVARKHAVGVDVEPVRPLPDADGIVHHYFSPREVAAYRILPACARERAFLGVWTRKEAFLKAHGMGLSLRLDQFDVSVDPDEAPRLLATRWDPGEASRWSLCCLDPYLGYVAAVAIRCPTPRLQCRILAGEAPGATTG